MIGAIASHYVDAGAGSSSYSSEVLADSPIAYWRLGEGSGTVAVDSSGNGHDGTYLNAPTLGATGLLTGDADTGMGTAANSGQCVTLAAAAWMNVSQLTVDCLVKFSSAIDAASGDAIVTCWSGGLRWLLWRNGTGAFEGRLSDASGATRTVVGPALVTGTTYHLAMSYDGSTVRLYINGSDVGSTAATGGLWATGAPLEIGRYSSSDGTTPGAVIDEVAFYGTALSAARIAAHAAAA